MLMSEPWLWLVSVLLLGFGIPLMNWLNKVGTINSNDIPAKEPKQTPTPEKANLHKYDWKKK